MDLVGFILRIYHDSRSSEWRIQLLSELGTAGLVSYKMTFFCKKQEGNLGECSNSFVCSLLSPSEAPRIAPSVAMDTSWHLKLRHIPPPSHYTKTSPNARHVTPTNSITRFVFHHIRTSTFWTQNFVRVTKVRYDVRNHKISDRFLKEKSFI